MPENPYRPPEAPSAEATPRYSLRQLRSTILRGTKWGGLIAGGLLAMVYLGVSLWIIVGSSRDELGEVFASWKDVWILVSMMAIRVAFVAVIGAFIGTVIGAFIAAIKLIRS